jgi:hypothetical protein
MCVTCEPQIANEILGYLVAHPNAQDTLEGIAEWWLLEQRITQQTALVSEALAGLVEEGLVIERRGSAGSYFKVNQRRRKRILARLGQE